MPNIENELGALFLIASVIKGKATVELSSGYYIVSFEGTTAMLTLDANETTLEEIQESIDDARS